MIIVTRETDYLTLHYITVTNSQHACAEFPIIDHKQLQWSGERESGRGAAATQTGEREREREREV